MKKFYPYDPNSTERITETATIEDAIVLLNHIPKKDSIQIDGFNETSSINLTANQFRCDYSLNTQYREANRILHFNSENDGRTISISYIVVGSPILADTMNEIKDHLENSTLHGSAYTLPTMSTTTKGGAKVGDGLEIVNGDSLKIKSATETQLGGVKIGDGLKVVNGKLVLALGTTPSTVEGAMWLSV